MLTQNKALKSNKTRLLPIRDSEGWSAVLEMRLHLDVHWGTERWYIEVSQCLLLWSHKCIFPGCNSQHTLLYIPGASGTLDLKRWGTTNLSMDIHRLTGHAGTYSSTAIAIGLACRHLYKLCFFLNMFPLTAKGLRIMLVGTSTVSSIPTLS